MATIADALGRTRSYSGIWGWIATVDHKRIGVLYGVTAVLFFLLGGIEAGVMRLQLAVPDNGLVDPNVYNQMFTMHGTTMIFLAVMPLSAAFFNFIVPLAIGARDVAFPRLNAFSYWVFLFGGLLLYSSFIVGQVPDAGWTGYANLTEEPFSSRQHIDFWALGVQVLGISSMAAAFNFIVTIINTRAPGMGLMRLPVFVWFTLLVSILIVLAFPVLTVALLELTMDRQFGTMFLNPLGGGDPLLWQHLFWIFGHPEVYIMILPAFGIISEVIPTFSRKPLFGYPLVILAGISIAVLGFSVWAHHMFTTGLGPVANSFFALGTMLIAIPTGVKIFNWIATMWGGSVEFTSAMLFAIGLVALFIIGGLSGVSHAVAPSDWQQHDSYYVVAHLHYVLFGGSMFGLFAGIYYWFPKITGKLLGEGLGKLHFWLFFIGMNLAFFPMHYLGLNGMPRRIYTYPSEYGWGDLNLLATVGYFIIFAGAIVFIANVFRSLNNGSSAGHDPWDAPGLEWSVSSPPPSYNFARIPRVVSRDHYWNVKRRAQAGGHPITEPEAHVDPRRIHMPSPSYWPIVVAFGLVWIAGGLLTHYALSFVGGFIVLVGVIAWANEPAVRLQGEH